MSEINSSEVLVSSAIFFVWVDCLQIMIFFEFLPLTHAKNVRSRLFMEVV